MRIGLVCGEQSGDLLAAGLLRALREVHPGLQCEAVSGPALRAEGCTTLAESSELAVIGLFEVLRELPRLFALRRKLLDHWLSDPPDLFIGVDAPDFTLGLERRLRAAGIPCAHYVSPTVWAWRRGRVHAIAESADLVLCLFPFEPDCYAGTAVRAEFVGHPFAAEIAGVADRRQCREALALDAEAPLLALLPGSRQGELRRLGPVLAGTAAWLAERRPALRFLMPAASPELGACFRAQCEAAGVAERVQIVEGRSRECVRAADAALVASGTATLETMLLGTPFAVTYRAAPLTAWLLRLLGLLKVDNVAMPNILAGRQVAPEFLQEAARPDRLGPAALELLEDQAARTAQREAFAPVCDTLNQPTGATAARALLSLLPGGA